MLIDFGLCARVDPVDSAAMTRAIVNLMRGDVAGLLEDAITLKFLPADVDGAALLPQLQQIFARGALAADAMVRQEQSQRQGKVRLEMRAWCFHTTYAEYQSCMVGGRGADGSVP